MPRVCACGEPAATKLMRGWKDHQDRVWCPKCWKAAFVLRACEIPAMPADGDWAALRPVLAAAFSAATRVSNWAVRELAKADITRTAEMKKLPAMPQVYLYPGARALAPELASQSVSALLHSVEGRYREKRFESVWLCRSSLPSYRYPTPVPVHNQAWTPTIDEHGRPMVSLRLGGERRSLRLRGGAEFGRQIADFKALADGRALQGELSLREVPAHTSDHRASASEGGSATRLMCKMVGWFPRRAAKDRSGAFILTTTAESLVVGLDMERNTLWTYNGDHVRRWQVAHRAQLQRWSEDAKMERRRRGDDVALEARREEACRKFNHRIGTAIDQVVGMVVGRADRGNYAEVRWAPSAEKFTDAFRWFEFEAKLKDRCAARGIEFVKDERAEEAA